MSEQNLTLKNIFIGAQNAALAFGKIMAVIHTNWQDQYGMMVNLDTGPEVTIYDIMLF